MNRTLLEELQRLRSYPSVTLLMNTTPGDALTDADQAALAALVADADRRLTGDVDDEVRAAVVGRLQELVAECRDAPATEAVALCASLEFTAPVRLARTVRDRVVIDDTFATRDLVADLNRTVAFRVVAVSDRRVRLLLGDRRRLVEVRSGDWPLEREPDQNLASWTRRVSHAVASEQRRDDLPTVVVGGERAARIATAVRHLPVVGTVPGNHDRTGWVDLHRAAWPVVADWLQADQQRALERLDAARSARRFAGGIQEIWPLANEGRVDVLVVEESHSVPARLDGEQIAPTDDPEDPGVYDDIVDETIEAVLRHGGRAIVVSDGVLEAHDRVAAALRY